MSSPLSGLWDKFIQQGQDSLAFAKGATYDTTKDLISGVGQKAKDLFDAVNPVLDWKQRNDPEASQTRAIKGLDALMPLGAAIPVVGPLLVNFSLEQLKNRADQAIAKAGQQAQLEGRPQNAYDTTNAMWSGLVDYVTKDYLPIQKGIDIYKGTKQTGVNPDGTPQMSPLTPEEAGEHLSQSLLQILPLAHVMGSTRFGMFDKTTESKVSGKTISIGQIDAARQLTADAKPILKEGNVPMFDPQQGKLVSMSLPGVKIKPDGVPDGATTDLPPEGHFFIENAMENPVHRPIVIASIMGKALPTIVEKVEKAAAAGDESYGVGKAIGETIQEKLPALMTTKAIQDAITTHSLDPTTAANDIASAFINTNKVSAQNLNDLSQAIQLSYGDVLDRMRKGDMEAVDQMKSIKKLIDLTTGRTVLNGPLKAANLFTQYGINYWRALITARIPTAMRNFVQQGGNQMTQMFSHLVSGTVEGIVGTLQGSNQSWGDAFSDISQDFNSIVTRFQPSERKALNNLMDLTPLNAERMRTGSQMDVGSNMLAKLMSQGKLENFGEYARLYPDTFGIFNHLQEGEYRSLFFQQRLTSNLNALKMTKQDYIDHLTQVKFEDDGSISKLDPKVQQAIEDAEVYSLKNTHAYQPQAGLQKRFLDMYADAPILHLLLPAFPRFMLNAIRWQTEHSPTMMFNLFDKEFQGKLLGEDAFDKRQAARTIGDGMSGLFLANLAYGLTASGNMGPKYYQIKPNVLGDMLPGGFTSERDSQGRQQFDDLRNYAPFDNFFLFAHLMDSAIKGKRPNLTSEDWTTAIANMRRVSDSPLLGLADLIKKFDSSNPEAGWDIIKHDVGQYASGFVAPLQDWTHLNAGIGTVDKANLNYRDTRGKEPLGSIVAGTPGLETSKNPSIHVPSSINPYTGEPSRIEHPILKELSVSRQSLTDFEAEIMKHPGIKPYELVGSHGSPDADRLVAYHIGKILTMQTGPSKTDTVGNEYAQAINKIKSSNPDVEEELKTKLIKEMFTQLRQIGETIARQKDPKLFVKKDLEKALPLPATRQMVMPEVLRQLQSAK